MTFDGTPTTDGEVALFIDGENLHLTARALGFDLDYRKLLEEFRGGNTIPRALYYATVTEDRERPSDVQPLIDWLDYNGFRIVLKSTKEYVDPNGRRRIRGGSFHVELAVEAMALAEQLDEMVLFSGNGAFRPVVKAVQRRGVRVTVVSTIATAPPMIADELRRQADCFIDLVDLRERLGRSVSDRATSRRKPQR